jgi:ribosomal-protein-alanine N-acetyltransferase
VQIRQATLEDLEGIYEVETCCFSNPWAKESIQKDLESPITTYVVAEIEGQIIAFAGLWKVLDEGQITNIAVHPSYRGLKIGKRLLQELVSIAVDAQIKVMLLEVRKSNEIARRLYESQGFKVIGQRKGYYQKPVEDALVLERLVE